MFVKWLTENYFEIEIEINNKHDTADPWYVGN